MLCWQLLDGSAGSVLGKSTGTEKQSLRVSTLLLVLLPCKKLVTVIDFAYRIRWMTILYASSLTYCMLQYICTIAGRERQDRKQLPRPLLALVAELQLWSALRDNVCYCQYSTQLMLYCHQFMFLCCGLFQNV